MITYLVGPLRFVLYLYQLGIYHDAAERAYKCTVLNPQPPNLVSADRVTSLAIGNTSYSLILTWARITIAHHGKEQEQGR